MHTTSQYDPPVKLDANTVRLWQQATQAGITFRFDPCKEELITNFDKMTTDGADTKADLEEKETEFRERFDCRKKTLTELVRQIETLEYLTRAFDANNATAELAQRCCDKLEEKLCHRLHERHGNP